MSVYGDGPGGDGRAMEAGVPMLMQGSLRLTGQPPQKKVDEFWKKFTTKAPGKGKKS
jgi:hypothetical protein